MPARHILIRHPERCTPTAPPVGRLRLMRTTPPAHRRTVGVLIRRVRSAPGERQNHRAARAALLQRRARAAPARFVVHRPAHWSPRRSSTASAPIVVWPTAGNDPPNTVLTTNDTHRLLLMTAARPPGSSVTAARARARDRDSETAPYHTDMTSVCAFERAACSLGDVSCSGAGSEGRRWPDPPANPGGSGDGTERRRRRRAASGRRSGRSRRSGPGPSRRCGPRPGSS